MCEDGPCEYADSAELVEGVYALVTKHLEEGGSTFDVALSLVTSAITATYAMAPTKEEAMMVVGSALTAASEAMHEKECAERGEDDEAVSLALSQVHRAEN